MIDTTFWQAVADSWINIYSQEDIRRNESVVDEMFLDAMEHYVEEKSILDEIMASFDDEDDEDEY